MFYSKLPLIVLAMRDPGVVLHFDLQQWDLLIRQARRAGVLSRFGFFLKNYDLFDKIPRKPLFHIESDLIYADQFNISVEWEVKCINKALSEKNLNFILLKGASYVLSNHMVARGRVFTDVDILVDKKDLSNVEMALMIGGWRPKLSHAYDQKYYREWMHELPPMQHLIRRTTIDVHHNILPLVSKLSPDPEKFLTKKIKLEDKDLFVLSPEDKVLHSAVHLFYGGEFDNGFRDISDIDLLVREFSHNQNFWHNLLNRSDELNQNLALYYALRYTKIILATPIPLNFLNRIEKKVSGKIRSLIMDFLFLRALLPYHSSCKVFGTDFARWILYLRGHWLKMPLHLLLPHLLRKSWMRLSSKRDNKNK